MLYIVLDILHLRMYHAMFLDPNSAVDVGEHIIKSIMTSLD